VSLEEPVVSLRRGEKVGRVISEGESLNEGERTKERSWQEAKFLSGFRGKGIEKGIDL